MNYVVSVMNVIHKRSNPTYLTDQAHTDTKVSSPHIVELFEPFYKSSRSETERLFAITPSMKIDETALSCRIGHEPDIARLEECDADREECVHDPEFSDASDEYVRNRKWMRRHFKLT